MFGAVIEIGILGAVPFSVFCPVFAGLAAAFLAGTLFGGFWPDIVVAATAVERPSANKRVNTAEVISILLK